MSVTLMRIIILALLSLLLVSCDQNPDFSKIKSSAERGDAGDQYLLGLMYDYGRGIPENDAEAAKWYRLAAEQGISNAQYDLGEMYLLGEGVPANDLKAIEWFRLAAKQGDERAQYNLGIYYEQAIGVPNNFLTAYVLFSVSAAQGGQRAKEHMELAKNSLTNEQEAQGMTLVKACIESYYKDCPVIGDNAFIGDNAISLRLLLENLRSDDENKATSDSKLEVLSVTDVLLDFDIFIGETVTIKGFVNSLESGGYIRGKRFSSISIWLDTRDADRDTRKFLLEECERGCEATVSGTAANTLYGNTILLQSIE